MANDTTTSHEQLVGWVTGPDSRGTLNLVWSCAVTVFACTWSVLHLNVPGRNDGRKTKFIRKFKWMAVNLLFPELIFSKAICDLRLAVKDLQDFRRKHLISATTDSRVARDEHLGAYPRTGTMIPGWKPAELPAIINIIWNPRLSIETLISLSTYVKVLDWFAHILPWKKTEQNNNQSQDLQEWTLEHSYYAQMGGLRYRNSWDIEKEYLWTESCRSSLWTSNEEKEGGTVEYARALTQLVLAKEDIKDKSKADWLSRGITIIQVTWAILNIIVRHTIGLPVTQMEIATVAFAAIAAFTYLANCWKPKDVSRPTVLTLKNPSTIYYDRKMDRRQSLFHQILPSILGRKKEQRPLEDRDRVPNDFCWVQGDSALPFLLVGSSLGFGGLHCLAWNSEFPTRVEMYCWRTASLVSAFLPVVALIFSALSDHLAEWRSINQITSQRSSAINEKALNQLPPTWWRVLNNRGSRFSELWTEDAQVAFVLMPETERDWKLKKPPTTECTENLKKDVDRWQRGKNERDQFLTILRCIMCFRRFWSHGVSHRGERPWELHEDMDFVASDLEMVLKLKQPNGPPEFWRDFEYMVNCESNIQGPQPRLTCAERLLEAYRDVRYFAPQQETLGHKRNWSLLSEIITSFAMFLYTIARLTVIVLLFTTLRRVPADVYQNTTWTRFIPNVS